MKKNRSLWVMGKIAFWILIILIFFYMLFPFYWAVNSSLKSEAQLQMTPATLLPVDRVWEVFSDASELCRVFFNDGNLCQ